MSIRSSFHFERNQEISPAVISSVVEKSQFLNAPSLLHQLFYRDDTKQYFSTEQFQLNILYWINNRKVTLKYTLKCHKTVKMILNQKSLKLKPKG